MSFKRIWAVFLRYFFYFSKLDSLSDLFYWPAIDILLWGITSVWVQGQELSGSSHIALSILSGLVFWGVVWRGNYEISVNLLQEFWSRNLINMFSTPLKIGEWMGATMLIGVLKTIVSLLFASFFIWILFVLNVFQMGFAFLPYAFSMIIFGWTVGFLSGALLIYFGQRMQQLAWITPFAFAPFSAVFYPVSALPNWAQKIAYCLPTTYIFEGMRKILFDGEFSYSLLVKSFILNGFYFAMVALFFVRMFKKSLNKGLARLE